MSRHRTAQSQALSPRGRYYRDRRDARAGMSIGTGPLAATTVATDAAKLIVDRYGPAGELPASVRKKRIDATPNANMLGGGSIAHKTMRGVVAASSASPAFGARQRTPATMHVLCGVSWTTDHREILSKALGGTKRKSFAEVLMSMPNVGEDADFSRVDDSGEAAHVFDWYQCHQQTA